VRAKVQHTLPGQEPIDAHTYFRRTTETKTGTFRAMFASFFDPRKSVTGTFQVAQFRYTYAQPFPASGTFRPEYDELIETLLVDCPHHLFGSLSSLYLLRGQVMQRKDTPDSEILVDEETMPSTANELCVFLTAGDDGGAY
jgi:hypothetical protein